MLPAAATGGDELAEFPDVVSFALHPVHKKADASKTVSKGKCVLFICEFSESLFLIRSHGRVGFCCSGLAFGF